MRKQKKDEHVDHVKLKQIHNNYNLKEKHKELNQKFESIGRKITQNKERKKMNSLMHREMENLRMSDFIDHRTSNKDLGFKEKCDIVEKHIGMSITMNEKK